MLLTKKQFVRNYVCLLVAAGGAVRSTLTPTQHPAVSSPEAYLTPAHWIPEVHLRPTDEGRHLMNSSQ